VKALQGSGEFHEAVHLGSREKLACNFVIENNGMPFSVSCVKTKRRDIITQLPK